MVEIDVKELLEKGAYFGHKISRTNPKSLDYVYKAQNGIYIIDLFKTKTQLEKACNYLTEAGKNNETLLIVATKRVIKDFLINLLTQEKILYLCEKWPAGFFTNFPEINKNIKRINTWATEKNTGMWDTMIKHEMVKLDKHLNKLLKVYRGVLKLGEIPQNILIIDIKKEKNALNESLKIKNQQLLSGKKPIQIIGICDTNSDPHLVDLPIVANDDSFPSLEFILNHLISSYTKGVAKALSSEEKEKQLKKEVKITEPKEKVAVNEEKTPVKAEKKVKAKTKKVLVKKTKKSK